MSRVVSKSPLQTEKLNLGLPDTSLMYRYLLKYSEICPIPFCHSPSLVQLGWSDASLQKEKKKWWATFPS